MLQNAQSVKNDVVDVYICRIVTEVAQSHEESSDIAHAYR